VPANCAEVSVLSWHASGPGGQDPKQPLDRVSRDDVGVGRYRWTVAAPPRSCYRQLDLRVSGRTIDSIKGGDHRCSSSTSRTSAPKVASARAPVPATDVAAAEPDACREADVRGDDPPRLSPDRRSGSVSFELRRDCSVSLHSYAAPHLDEGYRALQVPVDQAKARGVGAHTLVVDVRPGPCWQLDFVPGPTHEPGSGENFSARKACEEAPPKAAPVTTVPNPKLAPKPKSIPKPTPTPPVVPTPIAPPSPPVATPVTTTAPLAVLGAVITQPAPTANPTPTTTAPAAVLGAVVTQPAPSAQLPNTGGGVDDLATLALAGIGLGAGALIIRRWHRRCFLETAGFKR
jgi:LPXTG-motif cell wall-anchored protein